MGAIGQYLGALGFGAALALIGVMLTVRESRQKRYDERMDKRAAEIETERDELQVRVRELEHADFKHIEEEMRLRVLLRAHDVNPDGHVEEP